MHRTFTLTVPPSATEDLCNTLVPLAGVISLSVAEGAARKPAAHDVLTLTLLNRAADDVLRRVRAAVPSPDLSITTAEVASVISPAQASAIENDRDEAIWEEMESGLRHNGCITVNYLLLMALGGLICAIGLVSDPVPQTVAFVASGVIAPGFDPLAKVPLAAVLGRWQLAGHGLRAAAVGYAMLIAAAALTMWGLLAAGETTAAALATNSEVQNLVKPGLMELLVSSAGAAAGVVMLAAFRRSFQAGPLVALAMIPAAALVGAGLATSQHELALEGLERFSLDCAFIIGLGLPILWLKQHFQHRRAPIK